MISAFRRLCILLAAGLLFMSQTGVAQIDSRNPLLTPYVIESYTKTEDDFINILLLGIDYGGKAWHTSGGKEKLEDCHTDGVIVVSLNTTKDTISLISIPRDSLTYVPGVKGIYKFNGSINCAESLEEGFMRACDAASWHLGGVRIDKYVAVDATALIALGDAIGGVDFEVDMNYTGLGGKYEAGMQHLDGKGILDYMYARQNATKDANDLGRTRRQRDMLAAIFAKVKREPALLTKALQVYMDGKLNIMTNIGVTDVLALAKSALSVDLGSVSTHVLEGPYRTFKMNFTFNDEDMQGMLRVLGDLSFYRPPLVSCGNVKILIKSDEMAGSAGFAMKVFAALKNTGVTAILITTSADEISLMVRESDSRELAAELARRFNSFNN